MSKKIKLLSIITVVKNDEKNIVKTIKSITNQKTSEIEYIVIDGNSTDNTFKKINFFKSHIDKIIKEKDNGIYDAMNKGINLSRGKYIVFCNSGDYYKKNTLQDILKQLKNNIDVLFATVERRYLGATIIKSGYDLYRLNYNFDFATSHSIGFYIRKDLNLKIGYYDTKFKCSADYDLYLRLFKNKNLKIKKTSSHKIIGIVEKGGFSSQLSPFEHLKEEILIRKKNNQNIFFLIIITINSLIKILYKKIFFDKIKNKKLKIFRTF